jgi:hypothetical protein
MLKKLISCVTVGLLSFSSAYADSNLEKALQKESQPKEVLSQFERDYVLLKKGQWEFENGFSWTYNSANQIFLESFAILDPVFLTVGAFGVENIRRYIFTDTLTLRYGFRDNLQGEISVPIMFRYDSYSKIGTTGGQDSKEDTSDSNFGIGDVTLGLSYQPIRETDTRPAVITSLSFKTKTGKSPFDIGPDGKPKDLPLGSGYYALKLGINMSKTIDPVVVFGGVSYAYNITEKVNKTFEQGEDQNRTIYGLEKVDPGDTISIVFGMVYAVSYNFSMGFQFQDDFTLHTYVWKFHEEVGKGKPRVYEKKRVSNSNLNSAIFKFTTGWVLSQNSSLNINVGMGLTSDAPDFVLEIKYPIRF